MSPRLPGPLALFGNEAGSAKYGEARNVAAAADREILREFADALS